MRPAYPSESMDFSGRKNSVIVRDQKIHPNTFKNLPRHTFNRSTPNRMNGAKIDSEHQFLLKYTSLRPKIALWSFTLQCPQRVHCDILSKWGHTAYTDLPYFRFRLSDWSILTNMESHGTLQLNPMESKLGGGHSGAKRPVFVVASYQTLRLFGMTGRHR